jgi:glutathione synthase/RimK-type ligase-like ATP-grasp enzyme
MAILFVFGINDSSRIHATINHEGKFMNVYNGNSYVRGLLPLKKGISNWVLLFGKGVKQSGVDFTKKPSLIFNEIADPDTHRGALERCMELCAQVNTSVINRPEKIMLTSRDRVSKLLQGIPSVKMPVTVRFNPGSPEDVFEGAESENINFPFIVRVAGDHGGKSMILVNSREDHPVLHVYPFDGRDFYLTEFVDYKDETGLYHKQRIVVIDGEPVLRHSLYNSEWKIHGNSRAFMSARESWEDSLARMRQMDSDMIPKLRPMIREISSRLQLEYFGVDCSVQPNGEMLIFEANANMNVLVNDFPQMNERVDVIKSRIHAMLARHSGEQVI